MKKILLLGIMMLLVMSIAIADDSVGTTSEYRMDGKNLNRDNWDGITYTPGVVATTYSPAITGQLYKEDVAVYNGTLYVPTANGFTRMNASDISQPIIDSYAGWVNALTSRPIVGNGFIYQTGRAATQERIYQFALNDISTPLHQNVCSYDVPNNNHRDPILYNSFGNMGVYCMGPEHSFNGVTLVPEPRLFYYDADDVSFAWDFYSGIADAPFTRAAGANGYIYVGGGGRTITQLDALNLDVIASVAGSTSAFVAGQSNGPVVHNDIVYFIDRNNLYAANALNVSDIYASKELTSYAFGAINAIAIDDNYLYASVRANQLAPSAGTLYKLNLTNLDEIQNLTIGNADSGFGAPVVDQGIVYITNYNGTSTKLYELYAQDITQTFTTHDLGVKSSSATLTDDYIYGWANNTNIYQIPRETPCIPNWVYGETACEGTVKTIAYSDSNFCGINLGLPADDGTTVPCVIGVVGGGGGVPYEPPTTTEEEVIVVIEPEQSLFDFKGLYEDFSLLFQKLFEGKIEFKEIATTAGNYLFEIFLILIAFALLILGATSNDKKKKNNKKKGGKRK